MFKEAATYNNHTDLQEYTETVTAYIKKCIDDATVTKTITTLANQKPWMTAEVRGLLKTRDEAFRSGDKAALKTARANLSCGIKNAKRSLRACWPAASLSGTGTVVQQTARLSSEQIKTVNKSAKIIGAPLPSILEFFLTWCSSKTNSIVKDPTHPSYSLFQLLPSGRRTGALEPAPPDFSTAFSPMLWET